MFQLYSLQWFILQDFRLDDSQGGLYTSTLLDLIWEIRRPEALLQVVNHVLYYFRPPSDGGLPSHGAFF